ncbi:hypothetical protein CCACVL1_00090 [Corchorus capsularis]|uniref:Uncharacterized protein n=1 Tax=Corchorus capsularis TaxID=210143 RepID=A0A1R3KYL0_COCAP|nr:hypothetical protein CCACVL1_00090 [Corchorus capsularis]
MAELDPFAKSHYCGTSFFLESKGEKSEHYNMID